MKHNKTTAKSMWFFSLLAVFLNWAYVIPLVLVWFSYGSSVLPISLVNC